MSSSSAPSATVFEMIFPDQRTLGLHVLPLRLNFSSDALPLPTTQVFGCQVTRSSLTDDIQEGDILVSINGIALLSSTNSSGGSEDVNQTILGAIGAFDSFLQLMKTTFPPRTLRVFRLLRRQTVSGFEGGSIYEPGTSSNIALSREETDMLFGKATSEVMGSPGLNMIVNRYIVTGGEAIDQSYRSLTLFTPFALSVVSCFVIPPLTLTFSHIIQ